MIIMFPALKQNIGGHKFRDDCEMETVGAWWLMVQNPDFYEQKIEVLILWYGCLSCGGDCVEW